MKRIFTSMLFCAAIMSGLAQCPLCTPDVDCVSADGLPTICPLVAPNATEGEYYEHELTFYLPTEVEDPGSGVLATLLEVKISSVSGMPYGMDFTMNDPDSTYYPADGENHGCATVCGIPLLPGDYTVNITVTVLAGVFGFEVTQVQSFPYPITVEPGAGGTDSFTFDNPAACGVLDVDFEATIVAPAPSVTTYYWDFGNGQTATGMSESITYNEVGEYDVVLQTTVSNFELNSVSVSNLSSAGNGDLDDFFSPPADPYFILQDGNNNTVYTSASASNTTNTSWTNLNIHLANPPYTIQFFDEDDVSVDDDLGTTTVVLNAGSAFFDIGNGTVGTINISLEPTTIIYDTATVVVFAIPDATFLVSGSSLYYTNPDLTGFVWYINNVPTENYTSSIDLEAGGVYYCIVTNEVGCTATSQTYLHCPEIEVQFDAPSQEVYVENIYASYQWYYNGVEVPGATSSYLYVENNGNYAVEVTTTYGCTILSNVYTFNGIASVYHSNMRLWPNPAEGVLNIQMTDRSATAVIYDVSARPVWTGSLSKGENIINIENLAAGSYVLVADGTHIRFAKK